MWKRAMDLGAAVPALIVLSPVMLLIGVLVRLFLGSPVLFRQTRPGHGGEPFEIVKFRTMRVESSDQHGPETDGDRLTKFGRFLRSTSLDELPELWNVLKGEMSLVGPRPLLVEYLPRYTTEQARRHEVVPGLTGWAQVNGRNTLPWDERFELDVWYVDHRSVLLDLRILGLTLWRVVARHGISGESDGTTAPFSPPGRRISK